MIKKLKNYLKIGTLALVGALFYSGEKFNTNYLENNLLYSSPNLEYAKMISNNYIGHVDKSTPFEKAKQEYEAHKKSELEKMLKEVEKEEKTMKLKKFSKPYFLTADSLNSIIKQAYEEMKQEGKKWPVEFDKRLFRLMLKQESGFNVYAISPAGYMGLGQAGYSLVETLRPEMWKNEIKNPITEEIDSLKVKEFLFNPVENIKLSLEGLTFFSDYCKKNVSGWKELDLDAKRRIILSCYNAGNGRMKEVGFNYNSSKLKQETRDHHEKIMAAYYDPNIKIKL